MCSSVMVARNGTANCFGPTTELQANASLATCQKPSGKRNGLVPDAASKDRTGKFTQSLADTHCTRKTTIAAYRPQFRETRSGTPAKLQYLQVLAHPATHPQTTFLKYKLMRHQVHRVVHGTPFRPAQMQPRHLMTQHHQPQNPLNFDENRKTLDIEVQMRSPGILSPTCLPIRNEQIGHSFKSTRAYAIYDTGLKTNSC